MDMSLWASVKTRDGLMSQIMLVDHNNGHGEVITLTGDSDLIAGDLRFIIGAQGEYLERLLKCREDGGEIIIRK